MTWWVCTLPAVEQTMLQATYTVHVRYSYLFVHLHVEAI